jgi:ADP-ribose pyrophosphatase YjhB (NUDIX family)
MTDDAALGRLLAWARRLESIAATGLHYAKDPYDVQRYEYLRDLAAEMFAHAADTDVEAVRGLLRAQFGPGTPKLVVRAAVFKDDRILLVREIADNAWAMPGGWAEVNELPSRAIQREVLEESGYEVRAERLIYLHDAAMHSRPDRAFHAYTIFFLCKLLGGQPATSIETAEVGFFPEGALPPLSRSRNTEKELAKAFAAHRNPDAPACFD